MLEKEPVSQRDLLPTTPEGITVITGEQQIIAQTTDNFFDDVLNYLGVTQNARCAFVERKLFYVSRDALGNTMLDDETEVLVVQDLPVASAFHTIDSFNYVQGLFSSYLTPGWEKKVRERLIPSDGEIIYIR